MELIIIKANNFTNDFYRSFLCACFPANLICATSIFMSILFLELKQLPKPLQESPIDLNTVTVDFDNVQSFPW